MAILTKQFLREIGIEMTEDDYASLSQHFETTLEDRVINELVDSLSPEQATELMHLKDANDDVVNQWILRNVPEFREIVEDEIAILQGELAESAAKL